MKSTSQRSLQNYGDDNHTLAALRSWQQPGSSATLRAASPTKAVDLAITRDWLLGVDRERRNAVHRNGTPVRILTKPVKTARLSVAGLMVDMPSFTEAQEQFVRCYLRQVLTASGGNVSWAARLARRNRTGFHRLLVRYKLTAADFRIGRRSNGSPGSSMAIARLTGAMNSGTPFS